MAKHNCDRPTYKTLQKAQIAAKRTSQRSKQRNEPIIANLHGYQCQHCGGYHVGKSSTKGLNWGLIAAIDKKVHGGGLWQAKEQPAMG